MKREKIDKILHLYFGEDTVRYFHGSDALHQEEGDTYIKYCRVHGGKIQILIGGDNGEITVKFCTEPEDLENLIKAIIF